MLKIYIAAILMFCWQGATAQEKNCLQEGNGCVYSIEASESKVVTLALGYQQFLVKFQNTNTPLDESVSLFKLASLEDKGKFYCSFNENKLSFLRIDFIEELGAKIEIDFRELESELNNLDAQRYKFRNASYDANQNIFHTTENISLEIDSFETLKQDETLYGFENLKTQYKEESLEANNSCGFLIAQ